MAGWVDDFAKVFCTNTEIPEKFLYWAGLNAIASTAQRKIWIPFGKNRLHLNLYVVLVGPPGSRKSQAIAEAREFAQLAKVQIVSNAATPQSLVQQMGIPGLNCASVFASELATIFKSEANAMQDLMVELYDCARYEKSTKTAGTDIIEEPFFTMVAGTQPAWIREYCDSNFIGGGFSSRVIYAWDGMSPNRFPMPKDIPSKELQDLRDRFLQISLMAGSIEFSKEGRAWYDNWYTQYKDKQEAAEGWDLSVLTRTDTNLLKVSSNIALSEQTLTVTEDHLKKAAELFEQVEKDTAEVTKLVLQNKVIGAAEDIVVHMHKAKKITPHELFRKFKDRFHYQEYEQALISAEKAGCIAYVEEQGIRYVVYRGRGNQ